MPDQAGQASSTVRPGIGSASATRDAGVPKGPAKYRLPCTACRSANSVTLTEYDGTPS